MDANLFGSLSSLSGVILGGVITYISNRQIHRHQLAALREQYKTDFAAEATVLHFLRHENQIERSFDALKKSLGGFADDELRKILVRAGAVRKFREDGTEWWKLLERMGEYIEKKQEHEKTKQS